MSAPKTARTIQIYNAISTVRAYGELCANVDKLNPDIVSEDATDNLRDLLKQMDPHIEELMKSIERLLD